MISSFKHISNDFWRKCHTGHLIVDNILTILCTLISITFPYYVRFLCFLILNLKNNDLFEIF